MVQHHLEFHSFQLLQVDQVVLEDHGPPEDQQFRPHPYLPLVQLVHLHHMDPEDL